MPKLANFIRRGGRSAAAACVLVTAMAGVAAAAPAANAGVPNTCQRQTLTLQPGWTSEQLSYNSGDPSFCVSDGMVYLSGSLGQAGPAGDQFAVLPQAAWPAGTLYLTSYTEYGTPGVLRIEPDGAMFAYQGNASGFTSLAGVSFPVASAALIPLTLTGGWWSAQSQYGTGDPSVLVSDGIVHLAGSAQTQSGSTLNLITVLPQSAWPHFQARIPTYAYAGNQGELTIGSADGHVFANSAGATTGYTSFAGISYPTAAAAAAYGQPLSLLNGWQADSSISTPSYYLSEGVAYLYGALNQTSGLQEFAVLPAGLRPAHNLYLLVHFEIPGSVAAATCVLRIQPDGSMYLYGFPSGGTSSTDRPY